MKLKKHSKDDGQYILSNNMRFFKNESGVAVILVHEKTSDDKIRRRLCKVWYLIIVKYNFYFVFFYFLLLL